MSHQMCACPSAKAGDTVSRVWRKVKGDWDAWNARSLVEEPIIRVILDGTVVRVRLDRRATSIVLLVVLGVREDGQKVLLAVKNMGRETSQAWRAVLDDLVKRELRKPESLIVDGGTGLAQAVGGRRDRVREFIQVMIESELEAALSRPRYGRRPKTPDENAQGPSGITGHRHGHRSRSLLGTFGRVEIALPRARLDTAAGKTTEWRSTALRVYQRRTRQADSLIAGAYLAGTNTRRVRRALAAIFGGGQQEPAL